MESALKGLMLAAGVILTCVVIGIGFFVAREAKATAVTSTQRLSEFKKELSESDFTKFDDVTVAGSDVVNFTKRTLGMYKEDEEAPVYVRIETATHSQNYNNVKYIKTLRDVTNVRYVSPLNTFEGEVIRDENEVIVGIVFIEQ